MAQDAIKEMKRSVKGKILLIGIVLMVMLVVNVTLGVVFQYSASQKNVESMLTDNLNGSYALVLKGMYVVEDKTDISAETWKTIIDGNNCNTVILDKSGKPIATYMKSGSAQPSYSEYVQSSGQKLYTKVNGFSKENMCYAAKAIENTGFTLLISVPSSEYYGGLMTAFWVGVALVVIMTALLVIVNSIISKSIIKPLNKIRAKITEMSGGSLSGDRIDINTDDELGVLASSVDHLADFTKNIIGDIHNTADEIARENLCVIPQAQYYGDFLPVKESLEEIVNTMKNVVASVEAAGREVSSGSSQMSTNSAMLSQAAAEGTATVDQLSGSLNSVHEQINTSAEKAELAREMTEQSVTAINEGNKKMSEMLEAMREINATSSQIAKIIKTIQDISFQTNILSLNASIEAARAGAAGKGFAVVAGEVGSLAGKTAEAAKSTTGLIQTSLKAVEHGTVIANETAEMLGMIVGKANESAEVVHEIAEAATKQAESIKQSIADMDKISASMSQVNNAARDCADSSTMLSGQSAMLEDTVNKFIIDAKDARRTTVSAPRAAAPAPAPIPAPAPAPKPAAKPAAKIELPDDKKPAAKPAAPAPKPAAKPAAKIELPDDKKPAAKQAAPAPKPAAPAPKPAAKPAAKIELPDDKKPAAKQAVPAPKPAAPAPKPAAKPAAKIVLPGDEPAAKPAAPKAKPTITLPDDDNAASAPAGKAVKKATMQPVKRTVRMDPDKY